MDQNIALEALSALTGFKVKPYTPGGAKGTLEPSNSSSGTLGTSNSFPDDAHAREGQTEFLAQFNNLTTSDDQPADQDFGLYGPSPPNELTIENLFSTMFLHNKFLSLRPISDSVKCFHPGDPKVSRPDTAPSLNKDIPIDVVKFFSPGYDFDFRGSTDASKCFRGGESYTRPWGWYRFALNVDDKYPEGNTWLGSMGWRSESSPGEWPVSFHGTSIEGAKGIPQGHYRPGEGDVHGYGIYSTPDISIAENIYATEFTSDGKTYKVVMQNRINPVNRTITDEKDYWLIEIKRDDSAEKVKKIVTESIRPYGMLVKEV